MFLSMRVRKYHILEGYMRWWAPQPGKKSDLTEIAESLAAGEAASIIVNGAVLCYYLCRPNVKECFLFKAAAVPQQGA
jgi:hypothetical protein